MTTSAHSATAATPGPHTIPPSLAARMIGIMRQPRSTFARVLVAPRWADVLVVSTIVAAAARALVMQTSVGQLALVDQWERTALAFGRVVDDATYSAFQAWSSRAAVYEVGMALVNGPVATIVVAIGIFVLAGRARGRASFGQILSVAAHASVILALRQVVGAATTYLRETTASATTLGSWFPGFDEASPVARFLGAIDLFVVWWAVVLGIGIAAAYGLRVRRSLALVLGTYVVGALVLAVVMVALGGPAQ